MPELPEVQTIVSTLRPRLLGARIVAVTLSRLDIIQPRHTDLPALLAGRLVVDIMRRGKRIIVCLDDGNRFYIHLGMTGRLTMNDRSDAKPLHTHMVIDLEHPYPLPAPLQLRFFDPRRFGGVWWLGAGDFAQGMGPEPLSVTPAQLAKLLSRTTRAIKNALLDQSVVAGLGNIYVDESLFAAGVHPLTPANQLSMDQVSRLNRAIKSTLRKALRHRGSTLRDYRDADGNSGGFQKLHRVYDRAGKACSSCKTKIERIVLGGRSTHFCSTCQCLDAQSIPRATRRKKPSASTSRPG
ncbi:MAG TPA: bifunctional DNA-formamidopyrimidine glycosylase/DNA-(apurinic or apyrimidinic site) lyase [Tepidisphaeraceae bacterium]|jgi:formamidopyrimidine-DNA glycosylase|nr:bifunctional DNA-formamidopyrimidine glycosylase/DNA-(apurinic or apyrimidinic site) lyase [Tepidisphaeraceae bacterium]